MPDGSAGTGGGTMDASSDVPRTPCMTDANCSPPTPYCDTAARVCVQCLSSNNCPMNAPVCSAAKTCVECASSADCGGNTPYCNTTNNTCVRCLSNTNCGDSGTPVCHPTTRTCVAACTTDANCPNNLPICNVMAPGGGYCVECTSNANCGPDAGGNNQNQPVCLTTTNTCVACVDDTTCTTAAAPRCNTANNTCVRCMQDTDCTDAGATNTCNLTTHQCGCPTGQTFCMGGGRGDAATPSACYNTQTDPQHCGNCNTTCDMNETCSAGNCVTNDAGGPADTGTPPG